MKKKGSGEQKESTFTNSATILKNITLLDPRNSKNSKRTPVNTVATVITVLASLKARVLYFCNYIK